MAAADPFDLARFVAAQDEGGTYARALAELTSGRKSSHWMWFVFPQLEGLGSSDVARRYALTGIDEARAYLEHPVLGRRLRDCAQVMLDLEGHPTAEAVLSGIDALKLRSSMTLFAHAAPEDPLFQAVLERFFDGRADKATERLLEAKHP